MTKRGKKIEESPIYPHSQYIAKLYEQMGERRITDAEARAVLNARVFGSIMETWLPELRDVLTAAVEATPEFENAQILIAQAAGMAHALGIELSIARADEQRIKLVASGEVERIIREVKSDR